MDFRTLGALDTPPSCHPNYRALTFALAGLPPAQHTSLHWFATPGRPHLASPVGDHDCPCAIFPASPWLKRSLAYTSRATGSPCRVWIWETRIAQGFPH